MAEAVKADWASIVGLKPSNISGNAGGGGAATEPGDPGEAGGADGAGGGGGASGLAPALFPGKSPSSSRSVPKRKTGTSVKHSAAVKDVRHWVSRALCTRRKRNTLILEQSVTRYGTELASPAAPPTKNSGREKMENPARTISRKRSVRARDSILMLRAYWFIV